jgi:amidase
VAGPLGRTVSDTTLLLAVLAGPDSRVPLALDQPPPAITDPAQIGTLLDRDLRGLRIAWSADLGVPVEPAVLEVLAPARQVLAGLGGDVTDATPDLSGADEVFRTFRAFSFATFRRDVLTADDHLVGPNVRWNVQRGLELTAADLSRATVLRAELAERITAFFAEFDVLACPVSQVAPFDVTLDWVHEINGQPLATYLDWMASAYLISATGLPAISVPAGFTTDGRPVGLQLVGRRRGDWDLLAVARAFESATGYAATPPASAPSLPAASNAGYPG